MKLMQNVETMLWNVENQIPLAQKTLKSEKVMNTNTNDQASDKPNFEELSLKLTAI